MNGVPRRPHPGADLEYDPTECAICRNRIIAYSWPPVCCDHCQEVWDFEAEFTRWANEQCAREAHERARRAA